MRRFKICFCPGRPMPAVLHAILYPHTLLTALLIPSAAILLIFAFAEPNANPAVVYGSYALSAYALLIFCLRIPALVRFICILRYENRFIVRWREDLQLRMKLSLYGTVILNGLYALLQLFSGILYRSAWFYALTGYYAFLALMRFFLLKETLHEAPGRDVFREYLHYRLCGVLLLVMNTALGAMVFYIVCRNYGFEHHYILTIAMAAYTFTSMTMAIVNVIRYRRHESPVISASKVISFASALVSMLSLETSMLSAFDETHNPFFRQLMTGLTGGAVCVLVLALAVCMIVFSTREINRLKKERSHGKSGIQ